MEALRVCLRNKSGLIRTQNSLCRIKRALGGTCLNVAVYSSKSLLNLSENFKKAKNEFSHQGIEVSEIKLNIEKMMSNKSKSVQILTKGVEFLFKK